MIELAIVGAVAYVLWSLSAQQSQAPSSDPNSSGASLDTSVSDAAGTVGDYAEQLEVAVGDSLNPIVSGGVITNVPSTWPGDPNDPLWRVAWAIANAEGANVAGDNPDRLNNPGDISDGAHIFGSEFHSGSNVTSFPDKATGWEWLYNKLKNISLGLSSSYSPSMTWTQFAQKWAGNWQAWVSNVTNSLGVDPNSTFGNYVGGAL